MNVLEAIRERRSVRAYLDRPIEESELMSVLEAGRLAPSARNTQEWKFVVVRDAALKERLAEAARGQGFVAQAAAVVAACAVQSDHIMSCGHPAHLINLAIAVEHMALAARELGIGSCWIGAFDQDAVKEVLGIPDSVVVVQLLVLGYPADWPTPTPRKALEQVVCWDGWDG